MTERFIKAIQVDAIAPGGMKAVELEGREFVICNCAGNFFAIDRRCGHMNAPLEMGTLEGTILTCAMHCAQFDITTGEALSGPVPADMGGEAPGPRIGAYLGRVGSIMQHIRTESIHTYPVNLESGWVMVAF